MRIGLVTDSHIAWELKRLPSQVLTVFRGVDLILHAGDIYMHSVLDELETVAPVLAALGDDDYANSDPRIQERHVLNLEGQVLWLVHQRPYNVRHAMQSLAKPDIVVSGHEHRASVERQDGILFVNSGSPTLLDYKPGLGTVGILEIACGKAEAHIIQLK